MSDWYGSTEEREAAAEALRKFQEATSERQRSRIYAEPEPGEPLVDVTEHVINLLDMITTSMDWGSDFWTDADLPGFVFLCKLLRFEEVPEMPGEKLILKPPAPGSSRNGEAHIRQSCPQGLTGGDLDLLFGPGLPEFRRWMRGQTVSVCEGRRYNHATREYEPTGCHAAPHGVVAYRWDVERYLDGLPVID